ncbi:glycoside hydrolase family 32 protein [Aliiglaciecola sp. NS0011-25]|uniref:glycoside hydrolase family 32 protein n=1 Tax=Aliiglaciecola sp. NS0011-25 TaxID=3127654 RepID=UPI00310B3032
MKQLLHVFFILLLVTACSTQNNGYNEQFRPQFHYSPMQNWLNDPNGMFFYEDEYHLFYQYHPNNTVWGPMHWGHAVSKDLVTWEELPIALYPDEKGMIFSGSAVVDWNNSSGFGSNQNPPIVAMFTYHDQSLANKNVITHQSQAIAYSLDKGRTWTKYDGNPVIENPGLVDFRDPKVVWDEENNQWVMVLAQQDHIGFYVSDNLKDWQHVSNFGKHHGAHGGVWECPDLIKVKVSGSDEYRYVLLVSINPGGPNGGSATQYFVGDWDGQHFRLDPQQAETLKVKAAIFPDGKIIDGFENGFEIWSISGDGFTDQPTKGSHVGQWPINGFVGDFLANSFSDGDRAQGVLLSAPFEIVHDYINFYVAGGYEPGRVSVQLLVDGNVIMEAGGKQTNNFVLKSWSVSNLVGREAQIKIIDNSSDPWGFIMVDQIMQSDFPANNAEEQALWLDWGTDNYAGVTFANTQEVSQHPIFIGWMNNWDYARSIPTSSWRGAMTLPRDLRIIRNKQGFRVTSLPTSTIEKLLRPESLNLIKSSAVKTLALPSKGTAKIKLTFDPKQITAFQLLFNNDFDEISLDIDLTKKRILLERGLTSSSEFHPLFNNKVEMPLESKITQGVVEIWIDTSSIEVFLADGEYVLTSRIFPNEPFTQLRVVNLENDSPLSLSIQEVDSIWAN